MSRCIPTGSDRGSAADDVLCDRFAQLGKQGD
jgi:hypothetical protein